MSKIQTITVGRSETYNLGNYSNFKPIITFTAEIGADETQESVIAALTQQCTDYIHHEIDARLEEQGDPAVFSAEPRVTMYHWQDAGIIFLGPDTEIKGISEYDKANIGTVTVLRFSLDYLGEHVLSPYHQRYTVAFDRASAYATEHNLEFHDCHQLDTARIINDMGKTLRERDYWSYAQLDLSNYKDFRRIFASRHTFIVPASVALDYLAMGRNDNLSRFRYFPHFPAAWKAAEDKERQITTAEDLDAFLNLIAVAVAERDAAIDPSQNMDEPQPDDDDDEEELEETEEDEA